MNTCFNRIVEEAIQVLYCSYDIARGQEAFKKLQKASNEGDVDAMYLLARCYGGRDFCWKDFGFPEDDDKMEKYMRMSILGGSAMGVVGSMRAGMLSEELEREMPFDNIKEAWDVIYQKARAGSGFCQNMIGNSYYWLDIVRIEGRTEEQFSNFRQWKDYLRSMMLESIPWYEQALRNKIGMAGRNLVNLYRDGEEALQIKPQPQEAVKVLKMGAELGLAEWMYRYGDHVSEIKGREEEGVYWYKRAAEAGEKSAWCDMAYAYYWGEGVPKDLRKALEYAQRGLESSLDANSRGIMGVIYFEGGQGIPKDYVRAVQMLEQARAKGSSQHNDCLAVCYAMGYGVSKNLYQAKQLLEEIDYCSDYTRFVWGLLYTEGVGVKQDVKEGISYWKSVEGECPLAEQALAQYKKTWYGKWVRC